MQSTPASSRSEQSATEGTAAEPSRVAEFEHSLDELEQLVQRMEHGDMSLDDSLKAYERGVALYRNCQTALDQAELRVKLLYDPESPDDADDFRPDTP
jgi:exodeoxyribonuclease VII small subunit